MTGVPDIGAAIDRDLMGGDETTASADGELIAINALSDLNELTQAVGLDRVTDTADR